MDKEIIKGYHALALYHLKIGQDTIDSLEASYDKTIDTVQTTLNQASSILDTLYQAHASIQPQLLEAFNQLNRSVEEFNEVMGERLIEPVYIDYIPSNHFPRNSSIQFSYQNNNSVITAPLLGEEYDNNFCCACVIS